MKEHREEELAKGLSCHSSDPWFNALTSSGSNQHISGYGSVSNTSSSTPGEITIQVPAKGGDERVNGTSHGIDQEESAPLMEYKRKQRTSPTLSKYASTGIGNSMDALWCLNPSSLTEVSYRWVSIGSYSGHQR